MITKNALHSILIIEDETSLFRALSDAFLNQGFAVLGAQDGKQGLKLAKTKHPDVILLDIIMPKMDGITLLKLLREDKWGKRAQVIMLTNLHGNEREVENLGDEAFEYLIKSEQTIGDIIKKVKQRLAITE